MEISDTILSWCRLAFKPVHVFVVYRIYGTFPKFLLKFGLKYHLVQSTNLQAVEYLLAKFEKAFSRNLNAFEHEILYTSCENPFTQFVEDLSVLLNKSCKTSAN